MALRQHPPSETVLHLLRQGLAGDGPVHWPITGSSMAGTLPEGCRLSIGPWRSPGRLGAILVFGYGDELYAHRLVARRTDSHGQLWLITQGDGRRRWDPPIRPAAILGQVIGAHKDGRPIWPQAYSPWAAPLWVLRHYTWKGLFGLLRGWRRGGDPPENHQADGAAPGSSRTGP